MDFTKNVMLVFKNYLLSIIYEYKTTFYVFIILACLNLTNYFRFNNFDVKIQDIIFMFENGFITIFFIFNMMTLTIIIFENNKEFPNKNLTLREIVTGKILAVYIFIITIIITIFIGRFIEFIRANLLYNLLPLISFFINMLIIVFLYCTISVLIASIKNKISIIIYITSLVSKIEFEVKQNFRKKPLIL